MSKRQSNPLGEMIKEAIKKTGISQSVVAKRMDLPRQAINQLDLRKTFDLEFLQKLKDATGLDYTNYVFNPKSKKYEPIETQTPMLSEPDIKFGQSSNTVELSLSLKIKADPDSLAKLADLIKSFKGEASKYGFTIS